MWILRLNQNEGNRILVIQAQGAGPGRCSGPRTGQIQLIKSPLRGPIEFHWTHLLVVPRGSHRQPSIHSSGTTSNHSAPFGDAGKENWAKVVGLSCSEKAPLFFAVPCLRMKGDVSFVVLPYRFCAPSRFVFDRMLERAPRLKKFPLLYLLAFIRLLEIVLRYSVYREQNDGRVLLCMFYL